MLKKLWTAPWQIKLALFVMILSVLVDFASSVLSIASDAVLIGLAIWAIMSLADKPKDV